MAIRNSTTGTMGGEHFLPSTSHSTGGHQIWSRRPAQGRARRHSRQVSSLPREATGAVEALAHILPGVGDGQAQQEVQVEPEQVPDPSAAIITDASPEGLGAVLLVNNKVIWAYSSPVTAEDAKALGFEHGKSSSQGIVETLAVVVALKHWAKELSMRCKCSQIAWLPLP